MRIGIVVASIWSGALLLGLTLRSLLPAMPALFIVRKSVGYVLPTNRLAFWTCVIIGLVWGIILIARAMVQDLGLSWKPGQPL